MTPTSTRTRTRQSRERSRARIVEAATELVRERSYAELNVGEIMDRAGIGRTIFYRHFDDLGDLLLTAGREAIEELYEAQVALAATRDHHDADSIREAIARAVAVYSAHGPLIRAVVEAAASDQLIAAGQEPLRRRFDELVEDVLPATDENGGPGVAETARALNLLNESYLLDAFGREPRVSPETAVRTLTEIWVALINR
jgi:TetR/AcrR family transcriptional regulator, ethionamide resistance regulator